MTEIIIIAAVAKNGVIGQGSQIPWRIAEDFKRFRRLTLGHPCIMGDTTYASLPDASRPLPGRENIVLSLDPGYDRPGVTIFHDFDRAIAYVRERNCPKAFITGGASIYRLGLAVADTLELTELSREYPGDVYFPAVDPRGFRLAKSETHESLDSRSQELIRYTYATYRRYSPVTD